MTSEAVKLISYDNQSAEKNYNLINMCKECGSEINVKGDICCKCFLFTHSWAEWHALKEESSVKIDKAQLEIMKEFMKNPPKKKTKKQRDKELKESISQIQKTSCQKCGCTIDLQFHHIVYRSEAPNHYNIHNKRNLIYLCGEFGNNCHGFFHKKKSERDYLIKERKLWELFPEYIKKENFT